VGQRGKDHAAFGDDHFRTFQGGGDFSLKIQVLVFDAVAFKTHRTQGKARYMGMTRQKPHYFRPGVACRADYTGNHVSLLPNRVPPD
jgi:hypothetical protein